MVSVERIDDGRVLIEAMLTIDRDAFEAIDFEISEGVKEVRLVGSFDQLRAVSTAITAFLIHHDRTPPGRMPMRSSPVD